MVDKVTFNGDSRLITVLPGVTNLDIRSDVYSRWVDWRALPGNDIFWEAFRRSGLDSTPTGQTGDVYFLQNNWKLIIDFRITRITGVLYSDNFETAYYTSLLEPLYPVAVANIVSTVNTAGSSITAAEIWEYASRTLTAGSVDITAIVNAIFAKNIQGYSLENIFKILLAALSGKTSGTNTDMIYYAPDGITPVITVQTTLNNRTSIIINV